MESVALVQSETYGGVSEQWCAFLTIIPNFGVRKRGNSGQRCRCSPLLARNQRPLLPPPLDYTSVAALVHSVKRRAIPGRLETILQPDPRIVYLGLRTQEYSRVWLALSWHPQLGRLTAVPEDRKSKGSQNPTSYGVPKLLQKESVAYSVANVLRSPEYRDLILSDCRLPVPFERVVEFHLARRPGDSPSIRILLELVGTKSNVALLGKPSQSSDAETWEILACGYQLSVARSERPFRIGEKYELPSTVRENSSRIPSLYKEEGKWRARLLSIASGDVVWRGLTRAFVGLGSALAQDLVSSALGLTGLQRFTEDLRSEEWTSLFSHWCTWLDALERCSFVPHQRGRLIRATDEQNREQYSMMRWPSMPELESVDASDLIAKLFERYESRTSAETLAKRLRREIGTKLNRVRGTLVQYQERLSEAKHADELRVRGDLLMSWQHLWQPGQSHLQLPPEAASALGSSLENSAIPAIEIGPGRTPVDEARICYQRSRKLRRAVQALGPLEAAARAERDRLEQLEFSISVALDYGEDPDFELLHDVAEELEMTGLLQSTNRGRPKRFQPGRRRASATRSYDGHLLGRCIQMSAVTEGATILCGKSQRQNDYLTFQVAGENDFWFHAQGFAGSHCVLRMPPGIPASEADLKRASDAAAYYSKARLQKSVPVVYTQTKHVRKAGAPGLVKYSNEKVLFGEPDRMFTFSGETTSNASDGLLPELSAGSSANDG